MTMRELEQWSRMDISSMPREKLVDIRLVKVDPFASAEVRLSCFLGQIKSPYCFSYDATPVRISFSEEEHTLQERMTRYFLSRRRG